MNTLGAVWGLAVAAFVILAALYGMLPAGGVWKRRVLAVVVILGLGWLLGFAALAITFPIAKLFGY